MHHEQPPTSPEHGDRPGIDPGEQVGDIYEVDVGPDGVQRIEKLHDSPQIWAGSWSDYNDGVLHGAWIDAAREPEEIDHDIQAMLAASPTAARTGQPAEEWGIFDHEGFGGLRVGEQEGLAVVSRIARGIAEHGLAFAAYADTMAGDEEALNSFGEDYLGHYDSAEAYAEQLVDDLGYQQAIKNAVPESLRPYVRLDVAALARDMELGGDIVVLPAEGGGVWIFDAR